MNLFELFTPVVYTAGAVAGCSCRCSGEGAGEGSGNKTEDLSQY